MDVAKTSTLYCTLMLLLLMAGVDEAGGVVECYKCSYYTHRDVKSDKSCKVTPGCTSCQTRVYRKDATELVSRDCVERCVSGGVPVLFQNIHFESGKETCCSSDLCNGHPSTGASHRLSGALHGLMAAMTVLWLLVR